jgi:hypothetical protein
MIPNENLLRKVREWSDDAPDPRGEILPDGLAARTRALKARVAEQYAEPADPGVTNGDVSMGDKHIIRVITDPKAERGYHVVLIEGEDGS